MTVKIDRNSGKAPRAIVETLVSGQGYPLLIVLKHKNDKALVIPSSGINTPIEPGIDTPVKVKSLDQAWLLVSDLSEFAHRADNDSDDFAVLAIKPAEDSSQESPQLSAEALADKAPAEAAGAGVKPVKAKETK